MGKNTGISHQKLSTRLFLCVKSGLIFPNHLTSQWANKQYKNISEQKRLQVVKEMSEMEEFFF
jgi:hypothetical protein